jgi:hypothetical protein
MLNIRLDADFSAKFRTVRISLKGPTAWCNDTPMSEPPSTVSEAVKHLLGAIGTQISSSANCLVLIINQPARSDAPVSQLSSLVDSAHISAGFKL